jgi:UDP-N-acetylglucosamine--N-acetylmuramyl-(pentapeptide) pyrophosphoryl-undecaprenol N-acetylglucosamine transferase
MNILFAGGGTLGPVTPLLAVARVLRHHDKHLSCVWVGTPEGPERPLVEAEGIPFHALPVVKWPRYVSWEWLAFPFRWARVRRAADGLVKHLKPDAIVTAGGYTAVPLVLAAAKKGIPCLTHQLDLVPGLSNRLIAKKCVSVTTSFEYREPPFGEWVSDEPMPTPVRFSLSDLPSRSEALQTFKLHSTHPVVLIFGGGTGARALNEMVARSLSRWPDAVQLIHVTGKGRDVDVADGPGKRSGYLKKESLDAREMLHAYAAADLIISRAGIGALSEMAALKKAAIIVPLPGSQQEANAKALEEKGAVMVMDQTKSTFAEELLAAVGLALADKELMAGLGETLHHVFPTDDGSALAKRVMDVIKIKD